MNKRGISAVVATVLIILITIAAVMIIWTGVLVFLDFGKIQNIDTRLDVITSKGYTFCDIDDETIFIQIKRGPDKEDIDNINIILDFGGNSNTYLETAPSPNSVKTYSYAGFSECPINVRVAPIFKNGNLEEEGEVTSEVKIPNGKVSIPPINPTPVTPPVIIPFLDTCGLTPFCLLMNTSFAYYPLDGDSIDSIGNNDGDILNGTTFDLGINGSAAVFNTTVGDSLINLGRFDVDEAKNFSIVAWYKIYDTNTVGNSPSRIISKGNGSSLPDSSWMLGLWTDTSPGDKPGYKLRLITDLGEDEISAEAATDVENNTWTFVAITYNKTIATIYEANGAGVITPLVTGVISGSQLAQNSDHEVWIGNQPGEPYTEFEGEIDNVAIFEKELSLAELQLIYDATS